MNLRTLDFHPLSEHLMVTRPSIFTFYLGSSHALHSFMNPSSPSLRSSQWFLQDGSLSSNDPLAKGPAPKAKKPRRFVSRVGYLPRCMGGSRPFRAALRLLSVVWQMLSKASLVKKAWMPRGHGQKKGIRFWPVEFKEKPCPQKGKNGRHWATKEWLFMASCDSA